MIFFEPRSTYRNVISRNTGSLSRGDNVNEHLEKDKGSDELADAGGRAGLARALPLPPPTPTSSSWHPSLSHGLGHKGSVSPRQRQGVPGRACPVLWAMALDFCLRARYVSPELPLIGTCRCGGDTHLPFTGLTADQGNLEHS